MTISVLFATRTCCCLSKQNATQRNAIVIYIYLLVFWFTVDTNKHVDRVSGWWFTSMMRVSGRRTNPFLVGVFTLFVLGESNYRGELFVLWSRRGSQWKWKGVQTAHVLVVRVLD